jgi:2-dehydropantoate 2-reductase
MDLNIGVMGAGGVGGYFGSKLCRLISNAGTKVFFIARGPHLDAIRRNGLCVRTAEEGAETVHPSLATDDFDALPMLDVCLMCVKAYDLQNACRRLRHCLSDATVIIPLLNGIDIYERMRSELEAGLILPACTYIGVQIASSGEIFQKGGDCSILLGSDPQASFFKPHFLFRLFDECYVDYEWFKDVSPELWRKYIFIAAFGMVMAVFNKTLGQVLETPELGEKVRAVMEEIAAVARGKGIQLPAGIVDISYRHGGDFAYDAKTSFQRDFEDRNRPDERDIFAGTILRTGAQLGIETPATRELRDLMEQRKPWPVR